MKIRPGRKPKSMLEFNKSLFFEVLENYKGKRFKLRELTQRKSEQTTFSLGKEIIKSLESLATDAEVKVKEVIDQAIERCMENLTGLSNEWGSGEALFHKFTTIRKGQKIRKSYVISFEAMRLLNNLSIKLKIPRDMIMETIIIDYALFVKKSNEKKIQNYHLVNDKIIKLHEIVESTLQEVEALLGPDDPLTENLDYMEYYGSEAKQNLEKVREKGKPLKPITRIKLQFKKVTDL